MEKRRSRRRIMNELPSDLWFKILRRIPAAHLFPLKAVCKTFHRLISNDFFARLPHLKDLITKHPKPTTSAFIISTDQAATTLSYDLEKGTFRVCPDIESIFEHWCSSNHVIDDSPIPPIRHCLHRHLLIDSYHGLLLVRICDRLLLHNPITRSSIQFLPSICGFSQLDFGCWKIAYDNVSAKYKVFGLRLRRNKVSLYVFDVEDGRSHMPREITTTTEVGSDQIILYDVIKESVLVNRNVYWLIITKESEKEKWQTCIVSASVTTEEVETRSCSDLPFWIGVDHHTLFAANGTFYIGRTFYPNEPFHLWVLKGLESENPNPTWRMEHYIGLSGPYFHLRPLGLFHDQLLIMIMQSHQCYQLCMYDVISGELKKIMLLRGEEFDKITWGIYVERERKSFGRPFRIVEHIDIV